MKKLILTAVLLVSSVACYAEMKQALILHMETGGKITYFLDEQPKISFAGQQMVVDVNGTDSAIPMDDVNHWEVGMAEFTGVANLEAEPQVQISVNGTDVTVYNPAEGAVAVYDINGRLYGSSTKVETTFTLAKGLYIITVSNKSYKIAVR